MAGGTEAVLWIDVLTTAERAIEVRREKEMSRTVDSSEQQRTRGRRRGSEREQDAHAYAHAHLDRSVEGKCSVRCT